MKYRLSTLCLLVLICAILLGWYVDRNTRNRHAIVGTWYYPTNDISVLGYTSLLNIRPDGTFTKIQGYRGHHETFDGKYAVQENGLVIFHVKSKTVGSVFDSMVGGEPRKTQLDVPYCCRCGIDPAGYLVIDAEDWFIDNRDEIGIRWETCARDTNYVIQGRETQTTNTLTSATAR